MTPPLPAPPAQADDRARTQRRVRLVAAVGFGGFFAVFFLPPIHQPEAYHHFADSRTLAGIPNCLNVLSNLPFLVVGLWGLGLLTKRGNFVNSAERLPWVVFFVGVLLTCFGSGYYHWSPDDATLVWDRLPMTVAFMSLLSATVAERISVAAGVRLLGPLVGIGIGSVCWWRWTGNLWPYAAAQYYSILLIGLLLALFPPRYTREADLLVVQCWYVLAKVAEALDVRIFAATGWLSGHTIKHLVAALAVYWVLRMLIKRSPLRRPYSPDLP